MKAKEFYQKLVIGGRWKKVHKFLTTGEQQEREWLLETMGMAATQSDESYNQLVEAFQHAEDKPTKLAAIAALGTCGRSAATSQLEYAANHTEDPEILEALTKARHNLKASN